MQKQKQNHRYVGVITNEFAKDKWQPLQQQQKSMSVNTFKAN